MRPALRILALGLLAVTLSGCIKVEMSITLNEDDTADGSILMAIEKGIGEAFELSDEDLLGELTSEASGDFESEVVEPYEDETHIGQLVTFSGEALGEFDEGDEGMRIYRDGDDYVVAGTADTGEGDEDLGAMPGAEMTLSVTFPGPVSEHNGTLEDTTVTWDLLAHEGDLSARGAASPPPVVPLWAWIAGGAVLAALAAVAVVLVVRRSRGAEETQPYEPGPEATFTPDATAPAEPPADTIEGSVDGTGGEEAPPR